MLGNLGLEKLVVVLGVGLVVLGPERLPKFAADAGRLVRTLRRLAQEATGDLKAELEPHLADLDLSDFDVARLRPLIDRLLGDLPAGASSGENSLAAPVERASAAPVERASAAPVERASAAPVERASAAPGAVGTSDIPPVFDPEAT
ncbi:MAG: twin-arginine translocase TatA/TatE family subunit [Mycobacteriales bacterium]